MNIHLKSLGCRLNEAELEGWAMEFQQAGHTIVNDASDAQLTVVNTCAVTKEAVRKSRKTINRLRRENPQSKLVVSGCIVATGESGSAAELGVDMLVDNKDKNKLVSSVTEKWQIPIMPEGATQPTESALFARSRQRAFIKIQDGCRYRCSYCIVTVARGEEISTPVAEIITQINSLHESGVQEVVLTGVHVGGYGSDINSNLTDLVRQILSDTSIPRVRFASVEPWDLGEHFFDLFNNPRLMPHIHLPLQSGSDTVLRRMSRRCHTEDFARLVEQARAQHPAFNITTDIIVGFPGETDQEWQQTMEFIDTVKFGHIHIFSYSPRQGTKAAGMTNQVEEHVKKLRSKELHTLSKQHKQAFMESQIGSNASVLWESHSAGQCYGYTANYTRVATNTSVDLANTITDCTLHDICKDGHMITSIPVESH